ncbi:hypothetical protein [Amycolatopsis sp. lyj-84]|uniref:hypothetical protein n=1 Tax=Amycolatopsis sp. lyj-84 TaxID=2789284 RepID=UPI00397B919C
MVRRAMVAFDKVAIDRNEGNKVLHRGGKARHLFKAVLDGGIDGVGRSQSMTAEQVRELLLACTRPKVSLPHPVRIRNFRIAGSLDLSHLRLAYDLDLTGCAISGGLVLTGTTIGAVDLSGTEMDALLAANTRLGGDLVLHQARIGQANQYEPTSSWQEFRSRRGDQVQTPTSTPDRDVVAPVTLTSSRVEGDVVLSKSTIRTGEPWAIYAPRLQASGSFIANSLRATGGINLWEAKLENSIVLDGAEVGAVDASIVTVSGGFFAGYGFVASGPVDLLAMRAGNIVTFHDSELRGSPTSANLTRLTTSRLRLDTRTAPSGRLILRDVRVSSLIDSASTWPVDGDLDLEGLGYDRIGATESLAVRERIGWLTRDPEVSAASFERLAAYYQSAGDERSARTVRLTRERHLLHHQHFAGRVWGRTQDALFGYGFAPARALLWLAAIVGTGAWWFSGHPVRPLKQHEHPTWDPFVYALDLVVPIVDLGQEKAWDPVGTDKVVAMALVVAGWLLATAVVAGARRLLSRT